MTSTSKHADRHNDAVALIDDLFRNVPGWDAAVAKAQESADVAAQVYALRERHGLTQTELAQRVGTQQSVIARLEDANYEGHSLTMLRRIGLAVGEFVTVTFTPITKASFPAHAAASPRKNAAKGVKSFGRAHNVAAKITGDLRSEPGKQQRAPLKGPAKKERR